ncbi:hypothetical protein COOONC_18798 [Cooperia oncophora]
MQPPYCSQFEDLKRALQKSKEDMEMAEEDLKKGESAFRKRAARKATEKYEADLKALENFLTVTMPEQKVRTHKGD